jgi:hypothetical protein
MGFAPSIVQGQRLLDALPQQPPQVKNTPSRPHNIGTNELSLSPLEFVLYVHLVQLRRQSAANREDDGFVTLAELEEKRDELLQRYARLYSSSSGRVEALRRQWARAFPRDSIRSHFANINRKLQHAIPDVTHALFYRVSSEGAYGNTRYGLRLPAEKIELRPEEH